MGHSHPPLPPKGPLLDSPTAVDFVLEGLQDENRSSAANIYCPQVRRPRFTKNVTINHMDIVSCWKGLSLSQATEVVFWEKIFRDTLQARVMESACDIPFPWNSALLLEEQPREFTRLIEVDLTRLVHDMMIRYYASDTSLLGRRPWFISNGNMPAMVYNFVLTRDCFVDASPNPFVRATFTRSAWNSVPIKISWQRPLSKIPSTCHMEKGILTLKSTVLFPGNIRYECVNRHCVQFRHQGTGTNRVHPSLFKRSNSAQELALPGIESDTDLTTERWTVRSPRAPRKRASLKRMLFSLYPPTSGSLVNTPQAFGNDLEQSRIRRNYKEFEHKVHRLASVTSEHSEEREAFEDIFREGSANCTSGTEGSSVNMELPGKSP